VTEASIRRATGTFGLISAILFLLVAPLYFVYSGAPPDWNILTRLLFAFIGFTGFIVFFTGLREVIRQASVAYEWVATLAMAAGLVYVAIALVSASMEGGAAIASADPIDPTVDGPLAPGQWLMYGAIARLLTALFLVATGTGILRTHALPAWSGWLAYGFAALNLAAVPSMFFSANPAEFYSVQGWGSTTVIGNSLTIWIVVASVLLVRRPQQARMPERAVSGW
jgi:hypothetical protein